MLMRSISNRKSVPELLEPFRMPNNSEERQARTRGRADMRKRKMVLVLD
jgi:hypothetical protein